MRGAFLVLLGLVNVCAAPVRGLIRGDFLETTFEGTRGVLTFRGHDQQIHRCYFDNRTYFERDGHRFFPASLRQGDFLEVLADSTLMDKECYVRIARVIAPEPPPSLKPHWRPYRSVTEHIAPRGNLTFAGVVVSLSPGNVVLRTRAEGIKSILLRTDTRYLEDGSLVDLGALHVNARVFIRGGKNFENSVEAYQVIWGRITPSR
jgi:hypothetical protein